MRFHISDKFAKTPAREGYLWAAQVVEGHHFYANNLGEIHDWLQASNIDYLHEYALYLFRTEQDLMLFLLRWSNDRD